ncbi:hypothetical protein [Streptomyces sp. NRRL F-5126]|uniref:hypothetical protein n=1 Tax=Streptomyces sp. NRRL F-5126 TaxID=1463857 RepID=UPI00131DD148
MFAQSFEQAGRPGRQGVDHRGCVGAGDADRDAEAGGYLTQGVVLAGTPERRVRVGAR